MCYTFVPTEAAEHLDDEEVLTTEPGVLVGWKGVLVNRNRIYATAGGWCREKPSGLCFGPSAYEFPIRRVCSDTNHGFHVVADPKQEAGIPPSYLAIWGALPDFVSSEGLAVGTAKTAIVRVLVPRAAVRPDGHVTHLMIIPPGEHETREDIEAVAAVNRELVRARTGGDVREKVNEHNPQCGETVKTEDVQRQSLTTT